METITRVFDFVLISKGHPLIPMFQKQGIGMGIIDPNATDQTFPSLGQLVGQSPDRENCDAEVRWIWDLTMMPTQRKDKLMAYLHQITEIPIISDLSCVHGDWLFAKWPRLLGGIGAGFYSPTQTFEFCTKDGHENMLSDFLAFWGPLGLKCKRIVAPGIGMIYPRILSTLINEAYYALQDGLAEAADLDIAMRYGVNYPLGLIDWSKKIGISFIILLLKELFQITGNPRYAPAPALLVAEQLAHTNNNNAPTKRTNPQ